MRRFSSMAAFASCSRFSCMIAARMKPGQMMLDSGVQDLLEQKEQFGTHEPCLRL
jgi:hypothetical protein